MFILVFNKPTHELDFFRGEDYLGTKKPESVAQACAEAYPSSIYFFANIEEA